MARRWLALWLSLLLMIQAMPLAAAESIQIMIGRPEPTES